MSSKDNNSSSLEEMKDYFVDKSNILLNCLKYRPIEDHTIKSFSSLEISLAELGGIFEEIRKQLHAGRKNVARMQNLLEKVENIDVRLVHMEKNFPAVLKKPTTVQEKKGNIIPSSAKKENEPAPETKIRKGYVQMQYVTLPEFDSVPKYMKGRMKYEQVNKFVDDFNSTIEKKYQLLKLPRKELKLPQMHLVQKLKSQENSETKGLCFCTSDDLKEYGNIKQDKVTASIITILRHCSKVKEIRSPGVVRYAIIV